jgi:dTDP-L-rhamnose 4-epimerase
MRTRRAAGHAVNVGTGARVTVLDLARALCEALGSDLEPEVTGEFRAGDVRHCLADVGRACNVLGFEARRSLSDGLPELAEWVARQTVDERGDEAVAALRERGLVA